MENLPLTSPNASSIKEVCDRLDKIFLTPLVGNHWVTGELRWTRPHIIIFPLLLLEGNTTLPITPKADCDTLPNLEYRVHKYLV